MSDTASIHVWGFFDDDGNRKLPTGVAPSEATVHDHYQRVEHNVAYHGGVIADLYGTRTPDGLLVEVDFETPAREDGSAAHMWHQITRPQTPWADKPVLASADDVIAGRARYADTPGGHADRRLLQQESAQYVCRHGKVRGEHVCDDLADHYAREPLG